MAPARPERVTVISDDVYQRLADALAPDYELGREVGRGGMGLVYQARDTRLHREVAIKLLPPDLAVNEELRARFGFEAQLAAGLNHPHIVPIFDVAEREGLVWYVMSLVEGESLRVRVLRDGPLNSDQTTRIIREVAWALAYAHARGIVHRDIKPDNILLDRSTGRAMVTDFGIAKMITDPPSKPDEGRIIGSLMYMSPEQASGSGTVDARADIYALGLTGFFLLAGRTPFEKASILSVAARTATRLTPDWDSIGPALDPPLRTLLEKCSEPEADDRWDDAEQILDALGPQALAARPMPASIRRLVRDFLLIPTFASLVFVISLISGDDVTPTTFFAFMSFVLVTNFGVTLRAFSRRGFRWPDLRDGLEMELARRSEEMEATGDIRDRLKAILYIANSAGVATAALYGLLEAGVSPVPFGILLAVLVAPLGVLGGWIQLHILTFFGRWLCRFLPGFPTPESSGWFSRTADALLTRIFRPLRLKGSIEPPQLVPVSTGWQLSELGSARRSTRSIDELFAALPRALRDEVRPARKAARDLTALIDRLRTERAKVEREREHHIENLHGSARQAGVVLERLRIAIEDHADGLIDRKRFRAALEHGKDLVRAVEAGQNLVQPPSTNLGDRAWSGVRLSASVDGRAEIDEDPSGVHELSNEVIEGLRYSEQMGNRVRGETDITDFVGDVRRLEAEVLLAMQRGARIDPLATESLTESELVLERLIAALDAHRSGGAGDELEPLLVRVRDVGGRIEALLDVRS